MAKLKVLFEQKGLEPITLENFTIHKSLLETCLENNINLHHNCGGVCACSTCHIYVYKGNESLPEITDREEDFIDRAVSPTILSRLSCQCIVEDIDAYIEIKIPDQTQFLGE